MTLSCRNPLMNTPSRLTSLPFFLNPARTTLIIGNWYYGRTDLIRASVSKACGVNILVVPDYWHRYGLFFQDRPEIKVFDCKGKLKVEIMRQACAMVQGPGDLLVVDELNCLDDPLLVLTTARRATAWLALENRRPDADPLFGLRKALREAGQDPTIAEEFADCDVVWVVREGIYVRLGGADSPVCKLT